ncbi:ATP-grasp ribosomal peptide maturase [Amycolatopsis sp. H20-H5]|uniref:ATP-grasp ribosomal peptide maturase n=1 Tax=Amycolatopsis sp. H20-H5 TaxID=3046309 RepID=UPI002DBB01B3|nr:ATP-grasp ribosomal peptide maturase [Amycolatopsis sp. H20-H5]MEC3979649.1 ATP-grasp ribosomal peptide maturase [Amycolatopsis sp. H20-H5]
MGGARTVLVLTDPYDTTADYVVEELNQRGHPVFRCNPGNFPARLSLAARLGGGWTGSLRLPERSVALDDIGCAYYRRPSAFELPDHLNDEERRWARREASRGLGGVLATLPRWLNHPADMAHAEYKPVQLALAEAVGLSVPPTLITNDPDEARSFVVEVGSAVYKPLAGGTIAEEGVHKLTYANRIAAADIDDSVRGTAHLFQAWAPKAYEVRLTVVDHQCFAVRIDGDSEAAHLDWRTDYPNLRYAVTDVPEPVRLAVFRLLDRLRLRFGALDFVVGPDGSWMFLEINPNGQWAWLQDATGLPIAAAIADALMKDEA